MTNYETIKSNVEELRRLAIKYEVPLVTATQKKSTNGNLWRSDMTDKTFTFTIEQIKDIYRAGIRRGQEEATSFEWGSSPTSKEFDELEEAIHTIVNEGKAWDQEGYIDIFTIEKWFRENK